MTLNETSTLIAMIKANYPNFLKGVTETEANIVIKTWHSVLQEFSKEAVTNAIISYIGSDTKGFAPMPGAIRKIIVDLTEDDYMTPDEAWALVRKKIDFYENTKNFNALPDIVKRAVGDAQQLYDWGLLDDTMLQSTANHFKATYKTLIEQEKANRLIPQGIKDKLKLITNKGVKQIES